VIGSPLLRTGAGRKFLAAQLMDSLAAGISLVALPWLVLDAGGTQSQAGAAFLAGTLPYVALGLHAGHVGDHRPRKRVMVAGTIVQTAAALVIPLVLAGGIDVEDVPIALIYAAALVVTAGRVFVDAAAFGAIAKLVGGGHFVQGQAALSFVWSLGFLVGPAVGGALIGLVGIVGALWVQAAGFAVAVVLMTSIRFNLGPDPRPDDDAGGEGVLAGVRLVIRDPVLRSLTAVGMAWNLTTNVIYSLIVVFARHDLSADAEQAGLMLSIAGAAGLAGGLLAPAARARLGPTRALRSSIALSGVGALGTALAQELISATVAYAVLEFSALLFITLLISERQTRAAPSEQGRVGITGRMAALTAASCGALLGALLVAVISLPAILLLAALLTIVVAGVGQRAISV
jgi:MFS family permease